MVNWKRPVAAGIAVLAGVLGFDLVPTAAQTQYGYPPPGQGQYGAPPPGQGQYGYPPPAQGQYGYPPPAQDQYGYPPPAQGQYGYPPPAQGQYGYPPPVQGQYDYPPSSVYGDAFPEAPPGAMWVGGPGECLYSNGTVYWCAPGVVFTGFPVGWDFGRYPVVSIAPGIIVDPVWWGGWRRGHPGFVFRGRIGTDFERRAFLEHRQEIVRRGAFRYGPPQRRDRRPEERR
jgi:hypothetical protein